MKNKKLKMMIRCLISCILLISISVLAGCSGTDYENYMKSVEKTGEIKRASEEIKIDISLAYDLEKFDEETVNEINKFKDISYKGILKYDNELEVFENNMYTNIGGVGFDSTVYGQKDEILIELTSLGKFIKLDELTSESKLSDINLSEESLQKIENIWQSYANNDNVFREENILIDTPSGVVKSKKYSVDFGNELISFVNKTMEVIREDIDLEQLIYEEIINKDGESLEDFVTLSPEDAEVEYFTFEAYVDADGYVVKEDMQFKVNYNDQYFKGITFNLSDLLYDINKQQKIKFPEVTDVEILDIHEFSAEAPVLFDMVN